MKYSYLSDLLHIVNYLDRQEKRNFLILKSLMWQINYLLLTHDYTLTTQQMSLKITHIKPSTDCLKTELGIFFLGSTHPVSAETSWRLVLNCKSQQCWFCSCCTQSGILRRVSLMLPLQTL